MREPVKLKKGQPLVYLVLLVVAVAMMAMLRHCAGSGATNTSERPADDDTIRVANLITTLFVLSRIVWDVR